jgi:23S rRNA (pseudouridine1915-N3)-methyltransferase
MKITILSIGKFDKSPYRELFEYYLKRLKWKIELREIEFKNTKSFEESKIKQEEGVLLLKNFQNFSKIIILDERGKQFSSPEFANILENFNISGDSNIAFVIGGAFGLSEEVKNKADILLSISKMTLPHLMVRSFLIEQIYRASTIISNHPYHKN